MNSIEVELSSKYSVRLIHADNVITIVILFIYVWPL